MIPPCAQVDAMKHTSSETDASLLTMNCMNKNAASRRIAKNTT